MNLCHNSSKKQISLQSGRKEAKQKW